MCWLNATSQSWIYNIYTILWLNFVKGIFHSLSQLKECFIDISGKVVYIGTSDYIRIWLYHFNFYCRFCDSINGMLSLWMTKDLHSTTTWTRQSDWPSSWWWRISFTTSGWSPIGYIPLTRNGYSVDSNIFPFTWSLSPGHGVKLYLLYAQE